MKSKILIIDDETEILNFLKKQLEKNKFDVLIASSGKEGLVLAFSEEPDLILLDIIMPVMDGYEVVSRLRNNPRTKDIPIIMHSVRKETEAIFKSIDSGTIDYVIKPVPFETLLNVIRRYVL